MKSTAQHPYLLSLFNQYTNETQPFRKVHRMIDLFESIIKTHTVVILAEYVKHNKLSDSAKGLLAQGLRTPSLGTWQLFSRVLFEELKKDNYTWLLPDFASEFSALDKALNDEKTNVISFRNGYAHGATPSDLQCENDIKKFDPFLNLLLAYSWLNQSSMEVLDGKVMLASSHEKLSLHPMLLYRKEDDDASFAFFNDLKNDKIGLLNYPLSKHYREKDFFTEFHEHLPLNEWKKVGNNEFYQRIEELTETFKGRTLERNKLLQFVLQNRKGFFSIQGNPGIGKSALIAQFFKDLRAREETKNLHVIEYFIRRGTNQAQVEYLFNYLIRRTDEVFAAGKEIRAEGKMVFDLQNQLFTKWRLWGEQGNGQQLLFLIDGLDEGVENNVVNYLPRENFENILIIYGSRPGGHKSIDDLWGQLPVLNHTKLELSGLSIEDIRALIYEVANKYELERESKWIDAVQKRSQGNPLYLKLLCDAIENGSIALNDIDALPKEIDEYYKAILQRYAYDTVDGDALLAGLFTFAAAKDYLTMGHLGLINKLGDATIQRIGSTLKEVLYENPLTEEVLDYQLFHESFREYLIKEKPLKVNEAAERIIDFCGNWQALEGTWEQRYTLDHYATHLSESKKEARGELLMNLLYDTPYAAAQKNVLKNFDASNRLYQTILLKANGMQRFDDQLEAALCLVDLKYEEANDAPQVIEMITHGEIDLALKRIESFGEEDQDGLRRKFILYMLCLMELTLLDSKNKPFRKAAIESLLQHLDEHLPVDHSILKWNDFFPSYVVFLMACEWAALELDYRIVFKRTDDWENDWIKEKGPYNDMQFNVLIECARSISNEAEKSSALKDISTEFLKQEKIKEATFAIQEALDCARSISIESIMCGALTSISNELWEQGEKEKAESVIQEAIEIAMKISDIFLKDSAIYEISNAFLEQGNIEKAILYTSRIYCDDYFKSSLLQGISKELTKQGKIEDAIILADSISDESEKNYALAPILDELIKQGRVEEALSYTKYISDDYCKGSALQAISTELAKLGKLEEALELVKCIRDFMYKSIALNNIAIEFHKYGMDKDVETLMDEALEHTRDINEEFSKIIVLQEISTAFANQGKLKESKLVMTEAYECSTKIAIDGERNFLIKAICLKLARHGMTEEALEYASSIKDDDWKRGTMKEISIELEIQGKKDIAKVALEKSFDFERHKINTLRSSTADMVQQGRIGELAYAIQEALLCAQGISEDDWNRNALMDLSCELTKKGHVEKALACTRGILDENSKNSAMNFITSELTKQGKIEEALECLKNNSLSNFKCFALIQISDELAKLGQVEKSETLLQEAIKEVRSIWDPHLLSVFSTDLFRLGKFREADLLMQEAFKSALTINITDQRSMFLKDISEEFAEQGKIKEAIDCAGNIQSDSEKYSAIEVICNVLAKQGKIEKALELTQTINDEYYKHSSIQFISSELAKLGQFEGALELAHGIPYHSLKSSALKEISTELAKQGKIKEASSYLHEALLCTQGISNELVKNSALKDISTEQAKQGNWILSEKIGLAISQIAERHSCWKAIAEETIKEMGWLSSLEKLHEWKSDEVRLFYIKGWAKTLNQHEADAVCVQEALRYLVKDSQSIENLLQKHALHEIFFGDASKEKINRLNRSLNIQWALDIVANFPKEAEAAYHSSNVETWIQEIEDENDREDILGWAEKVSLGKMTEEKFQERIQRMI